MKRSLSPVTAGVLLCALPLLVDARRSLPTPEVTTADGSRLLSQIPIAFVPNCGQWSSDALFAARFGAMHAFLTERGWTLVLSARAITPASCCADLAGGVAVRLTFAGADRPLLAAEEPLPGRHNYFLGNDPSRWRSDVPLYRAVRYKQLYPGIDVLVREQHRHFEYDIVARPHADIADIEIVVEGAERIHIDGDALVLETRSGRLRMPAPTSWEEASSGHRAPIACKYVLRSVNRFGFEVPGRCGHSVLVIDPGILWSTFLGESGVDAVHALALDAQGNVTVAGTTTPSAFPTTPGAFDTTFNGGIDSFVTRLTASGSNLVYSTFLGGADNDWARAIAVDDRGETWIAGESASSDFPVSAGAFDTTLGGIVDAFVARLSSTGSSLAYSTFLGGGSRDFSSDVAIDGQGNATVVGRTESMDFPTTTGAFDATFNGGLSDGFVTRVAPTGATLVYSTFLGGRLDDSADAVAIEPQGTAVIAGYTSSTDFPITVGAFDTAHNGATDLFVARLSVNGASLNFATFLGGSGDDNAQSIDLNRVGGIVAVGWTDSADFPTTSGAFDTTHNGNDDGFVVVLTPSGSSLTASTYLGGRNADGVEALAVNPTGEITVAGWTESSTFPTTAGALDRMYRGNTDCFVTRLSPNVSSLVYSTFLGGTRADFPEGLALDAVGAATIAGFTFSSDFPITAGAFDTLLNGTTDGFVSRIDMLPTGVAAFGRSSAGCSGALAVSVTSSPSVGNSSFALICGNAPPNAAGLLAVTASRLVNPVVVVGIDLWVNPQPLLLQVFSISNQVGASVVPLPVPNVPTLSGARLFAQFVWGGPSSPPPCPPGSVSASNALEITVQP